MNSSEICPTSESEVENILLNNVCLDQVEIDKPLSPILNSNINRKFFGSKNKRKSRVRLIKKFENETSVDTIIQNFNEDSFSLSAGDSENFVNCLERLEEIEKNRQAAYTALVTNKKSDLCFKKPTSPAPKTPRRVKSQTICSVLQTVQEEKDNNEEYRQKIFVNQHTPIVVSQNSDFQTATGKSIEIPPDKLKIQSQLFEDILDCSQSEYHRVNKYSVLQKSQSLGNLQEVPENREISLTQDIIDSGISNTQILFAVDNVFDNEVDVSSNRFSGFSNMDEFESVLLRDKFIKISSENKNHSLYKRCNMELDFPPNKKMKLDSEVFDQNVKGFSIASGKYINKIASAAIEKPTDMFENMDTKNSSSNNILESTSVLNVPNNKDSKKPNIKSKLDIFDNLLLDDQKSKPTEKIVDENLLSSKKMRLENNFNFTNLQFGQFSKASGEKIAINTNYLSKTKAVFEDIDLTNFKLELPPEKVAPKNISSCAFGGFCNASGKKITITSGSVNKAKSLFEDMDQEFKNLQTFKNLETSELGEKNTLAKDKLKYFDQLIGDDSPSSVTQNLKSKNVQNIPESKNNKPHIGLKDKLKYFDQLIGDDCDFVPKTNLNVSNIGSAKQQTRAKQKLEFFDNLLGTEDLPLRSNSSQHLKIPQTYGKSSSVSKITHQQSSTVSTSSFATPEKNLNDSNTRRTKKKLGVSTLKQIAIPESKLQKAKLLFDEDFTGISPIKPLEPQTFSHFQRGNSYSTPLRSESCTFESFTDVNENVTSDQTVSDIKIDIKLKEDYIVTFDTPDSKNVGDVLENFENEVKKLEERLAVIKKRCEVMESLKTEKPDCDKKPKEGVLYRSKMGKNRRSLRSFVEENKPGNNYDEHLFCVTPQNSVDIHFREFSATVTTEDGATIVPNIKDLIGVYEIEIGFRAMKGIDPQLIPKYWIRNHFRWIIWKLTSYKRIFPDIFEGSLTVEHVIQQLKYRYDREIDKVERPALRKILEKDDAPQKRMVLCVSDIKKVGLHSFELELSDGWYGIRTVIDEPLSQQILTKRIRIGTKLVIFGTELMNCDGCHPLDVTDLTYLKINFNCTRRAKWCTRLGYQKFAGPFAVAVHSIHPSGGLVGCIDVCIARSYPFRYLEKSAVKSVWRNRKAEERRAQDWENDRYKKLEEIEAHILNQFTSDYDNENSSRGKTSHNTNVSEITCPKTIFEIIEISNDPESIQQQLSSSQKSSLLDYKQNLFVRKQQEMSTKVKDSAEKLKMVKREVVPVMKLLVVDLNGSPTKAFSFLLWRPTEAHVQMLKEESCLALFNVYPKINGDLHSCTKTMFKQRAKVDHISEIFRRKLLRISDLDDLKFSNNFSEFDTVGVVVQVTVELDSQEIWMCDISGRLLLANITEGSSTCFLLDNLKRGQVTSVCNLIYRVLLDKLGICRSAANHFTVFSSYPKYKHLQNGLDNFKHELPTNFDNVLQDCDTRIAKFQSNQSFRNIDESDEDSTLVSSRITSTDIALSLIDMDKFM